VKCIPFTQPAFSLLKLLVLQVKLSFSNSGGAIILTEQDFKKGEKGCVGGREEDRKKVPQYPPPLKHLLLKSSMTLFVNLITAFTGFIILKDVLLRTVSSKRRMRMLVCGI